MKLTDSRQEVSFANDLVLLIRKGLSLTGKTAFQLPEILLVMIEKWIRMSVTLCCGFLFAAGQASAQDLGPSIAEPRPEIRVSYLGMTESFLDFEVVLRQPDAYFSRFRIRNENGQEIYSQRIGRRSAVLKVKVDQEEEGKLTFIYTTSREEVKQQLEVKVKLLEATVVQSFPSRD